MANSPVYSSIVSSRAQKEIIASWSWYEERQKGLGDRFIQEVLYKIQEIERHPEYFGSKSKLFPKRW